MIKRVSQFLCLAGGICLLSSCQFIQSIGNEKIGEVKEKDTLTTNNQSSNTNGLVNAMAHENTQNILFNDISGWNHISYYPDEYKQLRLLSAAYHINATELALNNQKHLEVSTVLVRKLANWERQHSNGIKIDLAEKKVTFGNFKTIGFELDVNANRTVIPFVEQAVNYFLAEINAQLIDEKWLEELLVDPAKITFTFVGESYNEPTMKNAIATYSYLVSDVDEAVNITVTQADLAFYWQQYNQKQPASLAELSMQKIVAMIVTLDTSNDKTLRYYINEAGQHQFPQTMKELFLELDLTIRDPKITTSASF